MAVLSNILNSDGLPAILIVFLSILGSPKNKTNAEAITDSKVMAKLYESICLKCPVLFYENTGLIWRLGFNQSYLFRGEARTYDNRDFPLTINECDSMHYALGLLNVAIGINDVRYTCWRKDQLISSFVVHVQDTDEGKMGVYYFIVPILFTISTLTSLLMFYKVQRLRSQRMGTTERTNVTTTTFETINIPVSEEVLYESPDDMAGEFYFYGDNTVLNRGDIILTSSIPCTGRMKRWIASTKGKDRSLIVANTLCVPYYIYTEYITNGTLRDVLCKAKYDDVYSKTLYIQGLSRSAQSTDALRIGSFLLEPLKALFFLESIDCDHPAICSRKVLLTPNMVCKLYDFNLRSATKKMLSNIKFEENLRLPWFAPETIFKKH
ncbi:uncharacterized protein [Apostichopus japonicus]|uniref:uncharacterized protein isoform X2 n=1 Tax=Stichopus japonicus TaxID=307972 RepID=UPI003AB1FB82